MAISLWISLLGCAQAALLPQLEGAWSCKENISCILEELYPQRAGFDDGSSATELTYGEITATGVHQLILQLPNLTSQDGFWDLGSGVGKAVLQVFLTSPVQFAVGVELAESRHQHATQALKVLADALEESELLNDTLRIDQRTLQFAQSNALTCDLQAATVVFVSSLAMPSFVIRGIRDRVVNLAAGTLAIFAEKLSGCHRGLLYLKKLSLEMTWLSSSTMYLYIVTPPEADLYWDQAIGNEGASVQHRRLRQVDQDALRVHRLQGEESSSTSCDAAEFQALMKTDAVQAEAFLQTLDLTQEDEAGQSVFHLVCDQHTSSVIAVRRFSQNAVFAKHQEAKQESLKSSIKALLRRENLKADVQVQACANLAHAAEDVGLQKLLQSVSPQLSALPGSRQDEL